MRIARRLGVLGIAAAALVFMAPVASAHITPDPSAAQKGAGDQQIVFRVPNENPKANTVKLVLQLDQAHPIADVDVLSMAGWTSQITTRHLDKAITTDDGTFSDVASEITWSGGKIGPGQFGEFTILAQGLPTDTDKLVFKAIQSYDDGSQVAWIETGADSEHPAPTVTLTSAQPDQAAPGAAATPTPAMATKTKSSNDSGKGYAIGAIVLAGIGIVIAVAALTTGLARKRPGTN